MRRAPKIDGNQRAIVDALRKVGASVQSLAGMATTHEEVKAAAEKAIRQTDAKVSSA